MMDDRRTILGRSGLTVPKMGMGVMTWGEAHGLSRLHPSKTAYGGTESRQEEQLAFDASMQAGVNLFDTAASWRKKRAPGGSECSGAHFPFISRGDRKTISGHGCLARLKASQS